MLLDRSLGAAERFSTACCASIPSAGQDWKRYAKSLLVFSLAGGCLMYLILRTQTLWNFTGPEPAATSTPAPGT